MKKQSSITNELFTDYKAVAKAADLIERDAVNIEDVEIVPIGADKRAFAKDIAQQLSYYSEKRQKDRIRIEVNREGLYDMLPEGLFHSPPKGSAGMDEDAMIKDVQQRREEERQARLFFSPFDVELNHVKLIAELYENRLDKKTSHSDLNRLFELGWDDFLLLNKEQSIIWMHLLPEIQQKRNDINFVEQVLTAIFNLPFKITDTTDLIKLADIPDDLQMELGKSALGIDTIIGDDFVPENNQLQIEIGPTNPDRLIGFMPGNNNRKIFDSIIDYLVPVETDVNIKMQTQDFLKETILTDNSASTYLGYTVYL